MANLHIIPWKNRIYSIHYTSGKILNNHTKEPIKNAQRLHKENN